MTALDYLNNVEQKIELLPHNQELYDQIVEQMDKGEHSIFYSEGTGLGKSYVFMKLVEEQFKGQSILYIVPKIAIWDNLTHYTEFETLDAQIEMTTFTAFNTYPNENISCDNYDVVFIDECHHMLSDIQGKNVQKFHDDMVSAGKYVFGMTATPEIDGVFVDEECFHVSCYGLDMYEAIEQGLMPKMDIAIGIKEDLDIPNNLRERYSITGTQTLLDKVLFDYQHVTHWLAYFTTKEELEQNESELRELFPEYKLLKIYQGFGDSSVIEEFENSRIPVILMSVSMFLEGMHLKNVGGVLLYRNVQKSHTYAQILGRLCVIGQKYAPVMVDITGSVLGIKQFYIPKSSRVEEGRRKVYTRKDIFDVTARDYQLFDLMEDLKFGEYKEYRGITWRSLPELGRKLGKRRTSSVWDTVKLGYSVEEYIDKQLKDYTYEEYVANNYTGKYKSGVYEYTSYQDLAVQLNSPTDFGSWSRWYREGPKTVEEYIKWTKRDQSKCDIYRGVNIYSIKTMAESLGISPYVVVEQVKRKSREEVVDYYLDEVHEYRGVCLKTAAKVAKHFGIDEGLVHKYQQSNLQRFIDFMLDKRGKMYRGITLGFPKEVAKQLRLKNEDIAKYLGSNPLWEMESTIDRILNTQYRSVLPVSDSVISEQMNVSKYIWKVLYRDKGDILLAIDEVYRYLSKKFGKTEQEIEAIIVQRRKEMGLWFEEAINE